MPEPDNSALEEMAKYLDMNTPMGMLYERLADSAGLGADEIDKTSEGKRFLSRIWTRQRDAICNNQMIAKYIKDPNASDATAVSAQVLNLLIPIPGINMVLVACLMVRIGLRTLCSDRKDGR